MTTRSLVRLSRLVLALTATAYIAALSLALLNYASDEPRVAQRGESTVSGIIFYSAMLAFPVVGRLISSRQPRNRIAWIFLSIGLAWELGWFGVTYLEFGVVTNPGAVPAPAFIAALTDWLWAPAIGLTGTFLILFFPDGRLPSSRWKPLAWLSGIAIALPSITEVLSPGSFGNLGFPDVRNPLGIEALVPFLTVLQFSVVLIPLCIVASAVSAIQRFRRSRGVERLQMKWLAAAGAGVALAYLLLFWAVAIPFAPQGTLPTWAVVLQDVAAFSFVLIPISIGIAVLRYRLYDIDVVINKALVYGAMAAFITAVYVAIVVGLGRAIGTERNIALSIAATAVVAVAFQPVRERVQRLANRVVYGKRATPYEVLSEFSGGMAHAMATEEVLPRMARIVKEGMGVARVDVWLRVGADLIREATWPQANGQARSLVPLGGDVVAVPDADASAPVRHQGELLGVIGAKASPGEAITPAASKLLEDLASQAGLVLRNVRLIEELRTSRQRLVTAQDEERRRLERDLHDGAQQRLVAISVALRLARGMVRPDSHPDLGPRVDQASEQLGLALSELREFARGIHPAILTERGLVPALEGLAERSTVPATVESRVDRRLPSPVEATAYFLVSEALANVGKYSKATRVVIRVGADDGELRVEVADDGVGGADMTRGSGLRGLADRVAAVGGTLHIDSPPRRGTTVACSIPIPQDGVVAGAFPGPAIEGEDVR